ncbi:hypothetical protein B0T17DRAFT_182835 [Bombardia bombarda]|uniref:Secreted protein n=1 Tax=Bombardia bombarda TaxID=252184 RepID=A0AA40C8D0_9PEZI|nr:hypothetical protein B0T17DRAFT_182835 [Bombardia bombarda]
MDLLFCFVCISFSFSAYSSCQVVSMAPWTEIIYHGGSTTTEYDNGKGIACCGYSRTPSAGRLCPTTVRCSRQKGQAASPRIIENRLFHFTAAIPWKKRVAAGHQVDESDGSKMLESM